MHRPPRRAVRDLRSAAETVGHYGCGRGRCPDGGQEHPLPDGPRHLVVSALEAEIACEPAASGVRDCPRECRPLPSARDRRRNRAPRAGGSASAPTPPWASAAAPSPDRVRNSAKVTVDDASAAARGSSCGRVRWHRVAAPRCNSAPDRRSGCPRPAAAPARASERRMRFFAGRSWPGRDPGQPAAHRPVRQHDPVARGLEHLDRGPARPAGAR